MLRHGVWLLGLSCEWPGAGLNVHWGFLTTQLIWLCFLSLYSLLLQSLLKITPFPFENNYASFMYPCYSESKYLHSDKSFPDWNHFCSHPVCPVTFILLPFSEFCSFPYSPYRGGYVSFCIFFVLPVWNASFVSATSCYMTVRCLAFAPSRCHYRNKSESVLEVLSQRNKDLGFRNENILHMKGHDHR